MAVLKPLLEIKLILDSSGVLKGVNVTLNQLNKVNGAMGTTKHRAEGVRKALSSMFRIAGGIILFNIIRSITQALKDTIKVGLDFEEQMYNINSVAQLGAKDFKALTDEVINLALDPRIKDGPAKLAAGLYLVASAGYSTKDALIIMEQAALASTAGMTTTAVAADVLISTLGAYGKTAKDAEFVSNQLFQIINISKYTFEQLASAMDSVTPTAAALGIGLDHVGASMATMAAKGVDAQTATVQMNAILTALLKPTDAMKAALKGLGYETGQQMIQALGFTKTMQVWAQVLNGDAGAAAELFGDVRALRGLMTLTNDDAVLLTENYKLMTQAQEDGGAMSRALTEQMKSNAFQIAVLKKNLQVLAVLGFGLIAPYLAKAAGGVNKFISGMITSFRHFGEKGYETLDALRAAVKTVFTDMFGKDTGKKAEEYFLILADGFITIKKIVMVVFPIIVSLVKMSIKHLAVMGPVVLGVVGYFLLLYKVIPALKAIRLGIIGIRVAILAANPILLVITAAVVLFAIAWNKNWLGIREKTKKAVDFIASALKVLGMVLRGGRNLGAVLRFLPEPLQKLAILLRRSVKLVTDFFRTFRDKGAIAAFRELTHNLEKWGRTLGNFFKSIGLNRFGDGIKVQFRLIGKMIREVVSLIDNIAHGRWKKVWKDIKDIAVLAVKIIIQQYKNYFYLLVDLFTIIPWGKVGRALWDGAKWLLNQFWFGLKAGWRLYVKPWITDLIAKIVFAIALKIDDMKTAGEEIIDKLKTGAETKWTEFSSWLGGIASKIAQPFIDVYNSLWNAGHHIMTGLYDGLKWGWENIIKPILGWISDQIPEWKGPAEKDKRLLKPSGEMIMGGLSEGLERGIPDLRRSLLKITRIIQVDGSISTPRSSMPRERSNLPFAPLRVAGGLNPAISGGAARGPITVYQTINSNDGKKVAQDLLDFLDLVEAGRAP